MYVLTREFLLQRILEVSCYCIYTKGYSHYSGIKDDWALLWNDNANVLWPLVFCKIFAITWAGRGIYQLSRARPLHFTGEYMYLYKVFFFRDLLCPNVFGTLLLPHVFFVEFVTNRQFTLIKHGFNPPPPLVKFEVHNLSTICKICLTSHT